MQVELWLKGFFFFFIDDFRYVQQERVQRIESTSQSSTRRDIYIVQLTIYSFTRFNHLLYIAIYYIALPDIALPNIALPDITVDQAINKH